MQSEISFDFQIIFTLMPEEKFKGPTYKFNSSKPGDVNAEDRFVELKNSQNLLLHGYLQFLMTRTNRMHKQN